MIRVQVRDTAGNVFAFHDCQSPVGALVMASEYVVEGFRVEVVPLVADHVFLPVVPRPLPDWVTPPAGPMVPHLWTEDDR